MPRPIKWGGKIEGQLIRASTLFRSRTSVVLPQCRSGDNSSGIKDSNSGTKRRNKGALPLVGESELSPASELLPVTKSRLDFNTRSLLKQKSHFHYSI
jgi:hypothetical protein